MKLSRPLHRTFLVLATIAVPIALSTPGAAQAATTIYAAPAGSDTAAGTSTAPLKTLGAALSRATGGQTVQLAAGSYALARDDKVRTAPVTVVGAGVGTTKIAGLAIAGGQQLTFRGMTFTATVSLAGHSVKHAAQPASKVSFDADEFTAPGAACMSIREGSRTIGVTGSSLHDCSAGVVGSGTPYVSQGITIERNTIQRITSDAIQFAAWDQVRIANNTIKDIVDPAGVIHNDAIQLTGNSRNVVIANNRITNSRSQLIFIQDATGPIDGVQVVNNLLSGAGAVAVQSLGATHASFVNNTIWHAKDGGLWLRRGTTRNGTYVVPQDTLMSNNVARTIRLMEGATTNAAAGNVVLCPTKYSGSSMIVPPGAGCVADHQFVNEAAGDLRLSATSPTRGLGSTLALPATDLTGAARAGAVPGAFN
jgi:hypothetical protein